jgi:hypothetical protein
MTARRVLRARVGDLVLDDHEQGRPVADGQEARPGRRRPRGADQEPDHRHAVRQGEPDPVGRPVAARTGARAPGRPAALATLEPMEQYRVSPRRGGGRAPVAIPAGAGQARRHLPQRGSIMVSTPVAEMSTHAPATVSGAGRHLRRPRVWPPAGAFWARRPPGRASRSCSPRPHRPRPAEVLLDVGDGHVDDARVHRRREAAHHEDQQGAGPPLPGSPTSSPASPTPACHVRRRPGGPLDGRAAPRVDREIDVPRPRSRGSGTLRRRSWREIQLRSVVARRGVLPPAGCAGGRRDSLHRVGDEVAASANCVEPVGRSGRPSHTMRWFGSGRGTRVYFLKSTDLV